MVYGAVVSSLLVLQVADLLLLNIFLFFIFIFIISAHIESCQLAPWCVFAFHLL